MLKKEADQFIRANSLGAEAILEERRLKARNSHVKFWEFDAASDVAANAKEWKHDARERQRDAVLRQAETLVNYILEVGLWLFLKNVSSQCRIFRPYVRSNI